MGDTLEPEGLIDSKVCHKCVKPSSSALPSALLNLLPSLQELDSCAIQSAINAYLSNETGAKSVFLAFPALDSPDSYQVFVCGQDILHAIVSLPVQDYSQLTKEEFTEAKSSFLSSVRRLLNLSANNYLLVPVFKTGEQIGLLVCLFNKEEKFSDDDVHVVHQCFRFCSGLVLNTVRLEAEKRLRSQCESMLSVARNLFSHLDDVGCLLREIMSEARQLTHAERCSLFLLDPQRRYLIAKVFDGRLDQEDPDHNEGHEVKIPVGQGIAGHVANTGQLLNIPDAYAHPLFYPDVDRATGFVTRNILCFPILEGSSQSVLGVAELCNKNPEAGFCFSAADEAIATSFALFCGLSLTHSLMYRRVKDAQHRSRLANELMMYHMKVGPEDAHKLVVELEKYEMGTRSLAPELDHWHFSPRVLPVDETPPMALAILHRTGLLERCNVPREALARFLLLVKRAYRDQPYHNWMHAFSVLHFGYLAVTQLKLLEKQYLNDIEALSLLVACLCHDVDHRGTTNSFQLASNSVLAALYSSEGSVMERHHFAQTMCILNTEGCNIFENLSSEDYTRSLDLVQDIILATDLAHHFRLMPELERMADSGYDASNATHRRLLLCLIMTCADLCDQTKDWAWSKVAASLVYKEFFCQGDLEKAMGSRPAEMMDREKACIPDLQIHFIQSVILPVYKLLGKLFPKAKGLAEVASENCAKWGKLKERWIECRQSSPASVLEAFDEHLETSD